MSRKTIFVIEDDIDLLKINQEYLESLGYDVLPARTLKEAKFLLEDNTADLILLDVMLPDGDGWSFCEEIRDKISVPIIFLTCRDESESIVKGFLKGGDDYITKPYDPRILGARIKALLRRDSMFSEGIIEMPPLHLDLLSGTVKLEGEIIPLTQKEMQILACLVLNTGHKVKIRELLERLNMGSDISSANSIAFHVTNIRKKLKLNYDSVFEIKGTKDGAYVFSRIRYS
jgi:DNA-binding response OmpR family regulator